MAQKLYRVAHEVMTPTHDANRDISASTKAEADYDLTGRPSGAPVIETSRSLRDTTYGEAEEEEGAFIDAGDGARVIARSGNAHWDGDDYDLAGDGGDGELEAADPVPPSNANIGVWLGIAALGLAFLWMTRKQKS
jgi:LPXTG-motif cell wall-anchored protein